ncbi:hypothetical protein [Magnetococcus sp. PR-3]|uniref:hypothetical protein n=1 Tax=Magnetococcus sp. PR-3 TaxID=3120355 RepID=UPI002FCDE973
MAKRAPDPQQDRLSAEQLERIAWIAEQTKQALLSGMNAMQQLEQAEQEKLDAGEPESVELAQMRDKLGRLILAWDEVQSQMDRLVSKRKPDALPDKLQALRPH